MFLPPIQPAAARASIEGGAVEPRQQPRLAGKARAAARRCATVPLRSRGTRRGPRELRTAEDQSSGKRASSSSAARSSGRSGDADATWERLLGRHPKHARGMPRAPHVVLWSGSRSAPASGTPANKLKRSGELAVGGGIEKIRLDESKQSWDRPDSSDSEAGRRDEHARNQYKSPSKLSHLGERVRRFRPEWRPVPLAELYRKQHERQEELRGLQLESMDSQATPAHGRRRQKQTGTQRGRKKHKGKPARSKGAQLSTGVSV
jgi:hypothetical protein|eukprot:COSAG02_NODE_3084_length_7397_cov_3.401617_4_plen_262_part_00